MNKKILLGMAALVMFGASVLAGKAKFFGSAAKIYYKVGTGACTFVTNVIASSSAWTTGGSGSQALLKTSAGTTNVPIFSTSTCTAAHAIHFHA